MMIGYLPQRLARNIGWRIASKKSNLCVIFVVGAPRSGTTLVQQILAGHESALAIPGETGLFTWQDLFDPQRRHFGLDRVAGERLLKECRSSVEFFERCVHMLAEDAADRVIIEKTPQHIFRINFLLDRFPNSQIVHVLRDGRDCYCSSKSNPNVPQRDSAAAFAKYWRKSVSAYVPLAECDRVHLIRYEKLTSAPYEQLSSLMASIGLEFQPRQLDPARLGQDPRARLKEFIRLGQAVDSSSVSRWKNEMSKEEVREFEKIARKELRHFGYEVE